MDVDDTRGMVDAMEDRLRAQYSSVVEEPLPPRLVQLLSLLARLPPDPRDTVAVMLPHEQDRHAG